MKGRIMETIALQAIADYVVTLESRLSSGSGKIGWVPYELPRLQITIEKLQDAFVECNDLCERGFLRALQNKAIQCRKSILRKQASCQQYDPLCPAF